MKLLIIIVFIAKLSIISANIVCNNETLSSIDASMAIILNSGKYYRKYPENKSQVKQFCDEISQEAKKIEEYKVKCLRNMAKHLTGITLFTIKSMINNLCKKDSKKLNRFLFGARCANIAHPTTDQCHHKFIDSLLGIIHAEDKLKIPYVCCEYYKISRCARNHSRKYKSCSEEQIEASIEFTRDLAQNTADYLCGEYTDDSDKCDELPQRPNKRSQKRTNSYLLPFINIFESISEF